ncbi:MAG: hypothetical protein AAFN74_03955, partial [Myxococcota bacterium]
LFWFAWMTIGSAAGIVVLIDHAQTLRRLQIDRMAAMRQFLAMLIETARAVTAPEKTAPEMVRTVG